MSISKLGQYFLGSMIGVALYELVVYILEPYTPDWGRLVFQAVIISLLVTVVFGVIRWGKNKVGSSK